ncbi:(deoxy)nucleoside triphosphate pyrophosphohydrolase [Cohnella sp. WQ 127256]|uniref:(deoxy)nucleoside triphosphate pyrophosphohydrolase n=1 Tax=Cohnella sp. WQ 127256 TaxID=2938790 RepID=UPI0021192C0F|nr:(deoxy)nucleoside triphosphate pyrophosphohydrolase [Cohnella sp. WQ 127256]
MIARRREGKPQAGLWEFPGGKIEAGETAQTCLIRELQEEMNIRIDPGELFGINEYDYGSIQIRLIAYWAAFVSGDIRLVDHDEYAWVKRDELGSYIFAPADVNFVEMLL